MFKLTNVINIRIIDYLEMLVVSILFDQVHIFSIIISKLLALLERNTKK